MTSCVTTVSRSANATSWAGSKRAFPEFESYGNGTPWRVRVPRTTGAAGTPPLVRCADTSGQREFPASQSAPGSAKIPNHERPARAFQDEIAFAFAPASSYSDECGALHGCSHAQELDDARLQRAPCGVRPASDGELGL